MSVEKASKNFQSWHQKDPSGVVEQTYDFPARVHYAGKMLYMVYESDKWEKDGDFYPYEHDFDSHPSFYVPRYATKLKPDLRRYRSGKRLLCVPDLTGDVPLTMLAIVAEMVIKQRDGKRQKFTFKELPVMAGTQDNKTLVIFSDEGPLFVSGGRMRITERGIVH